MVPNQDCHWPACKAVRSDVRDRVRSHRVLSRAAVHPRREEHYAPPGWKLTKADEPRKPRRKRSQKSLPIGSPVQCDTAHHLVFSNVL
jgi:hypothetical protein